MMRQTRTIQNDTIVLTKSHNASYIVKLVSRSKVSFISKQQIWLTKLFQGLQNQTSYSYLCIDNYPQSLGAAKLEAKWKTPTNSFAI